MKHLLNRDAKYLESLWDRSMTHLLSAMINWFAINLHIAICLHRFKEKSFKYYSFTCSDPLEADRLLGVISKLNRLAGVHVTIDDGYLDAIEFSKSRAHAWTRGYWINFVCPERAQNRTGYSWDLKWKLQKEFPGSHVDVPKLSERPEDELVDPILKALGESEDFKLADLSELQDFAASGFLLGNHGTFHRKYIQLTKPQKSDDITRGKALAEKLGASFASDFAFPFGTPNIDFAPQDFDLVRAHGYKRVWTEGRPFSQEEFIDCSAGLPRFGINGRKSVNSILWTLLRGVLIYRVRVLQRRLEFVPKSRKSIL
jgi:hypothetical protein